jgi:TetR/AcrR family transcriptional regulator
MGAGVVEFCSKGYDGARIDQIAARAKCNIRMIYHYFGSKEDLYLAVLERVYDAIRNPEQELHLDDYDPVEGLTTLVEFTFRHLQTHPEFVALISNENMMKGRHLQRSQRVPESTAPLMEVIQGLLRRGEAGGVFRPGIDPVQLYVTIVALCYFHIGNRYTLSIMFQQDMGREEWLEERCRHACEVIRRYVVVS